eukprot:PhM_4_TR19012/c0_g1_i1/m.32957
MSDDPYIEEVPLPIRIAGNKDDDAEWVQGLHPLNSSYYNTTSAAHRGPDDLRLDQVSPDLSNDDVEHNLRWVRRSATAVAMGVLVCSMLLLFMPRLRHIAFPTSEPHVQDIFHSDAEAVTRFGLFMYCGGVAAIGLGLLSYAMRLGILCDSSIVFLGTGTAALVVLGAFGVLLQFLLTPNRADVYIAITLLRVFVGFQWCGAFVSIFFASFFARTPVPVVVALVPVVGYGIHVLWSEALVPDAVVVVMMAVALATVVWHSFSMTLMSLGRKLHVD